MFGGGKLRVRIKGYQVDIQPEHLIDEQEPSEVPLLKIDDVREACFLFIWEALASGRSWLVKQDGGTSEIINTF